MTQYFKLDEGGVILGVCEVSNVDDLQHIPETTVENPFPITSGWPHGPTSTSVWKWINGEAVWVETATLAELKIAKNLEINTSRLTANRTSFTFAGKEIACDELSRSDIDAVNGIVSLIGTLPPNWVGGWKAIDNTYVVISDKATWISFYSAMVQRGTDNFNHAQSLKTTLASANTPTAIEAITWN